ncbi:MAG: 3' terminal RNA ribose 2'-O-methyltransferase Hen1 [Gammaproteobacteria bacterium]|nr:3' terminal RNA ribose 2'-O-methyltransferase Hen1 [Gammaproteobacteria bacterium]MCP5423593.1 3' terminal RNA ribose 2'-O-methyltransferase Hen1 [Gammaproteobacteria bacterium]MCP5459837.1 3' terminal RNA ribose 2'-O-methyltransferase Hen1 [Gammaproteobacteria bacterium]
MLLTISTTQAPATDLGYLLHKNPERLHSLSLAFGTAYVYYPEATVERCTAALLLDIDPVSLVRGRRGTGSRLLEHYVNDRPYVASSFLSVALARAFNTALSGRSRERPELAETPLPLETKLAALPCRGGEAFLRRLFEPLGYELSATPEPLNARLGWGDSPYFQVTLRGQQRLRDLLRHLYVLIPVLDREKHYFIGDDEVDKLLRHGQDWLPDHPEQTAIARRYLKYRPRLTGLALARLAEVREEEADSDEESAPDAAEEQLEKPLSLNEQRLRAVIDVVNRERAERVVDLGCGEGRLLGRLLQDTRCREIIGLDVASRSLTIAESRLKLERLPERQRQRIRLLHGSLLYRDARIQDSDVATLIEVIEHLEADRLPALERVVFEFARPGCVIVTTPNVEYNGNFQDLQPGQLRHSDHRFEWTRKEFREWAESIAARFAYTASFAGIGEDDPERGPPTQMAVFARSDGLSAEPSSTRGDFSDGQR